ncbi:Na+/H+ antiporter [Serratia ureilytica]
MLNCAFFIDSGRRGRCSAWPTSPPEGGMQKNRLITARKIKSTKVHDGNILHHIDLIAHRLVVRRRDAHIALPNPASADANHRWRRVGLAAVWVAYRLQSRAFLDAVYSPLLFADGWKTPAQEFIHYGREILCLALVLVIITVVGVGYLIHFLLPSIPLAAAFALAAVLSPTDAVALSGIVGKGRMPKPVMSVIEGEALMNDASGLVSLNFSIAVALGAMAFTLESAFLTFLQVSIGGVLCGIIIVFLYNQMVKFIHKWMYNDSATQIIFSLLLPFSCYLIAERIGVSGILAAVSAGMMIGQSKVNRSMPLVRLRTNNIWEMLEFVFNGMVFILLGLQLPGILNFTVAQTGIDHSISLETLLAYVVIIYFSLIAVRLIWLWLMKVGSATLMRKDPLLFSKFSTRDLFVAAFAGVRGR